MPGLDARREDNHAASACNAVRCWPNSSCSSCARRWRSSSCSVRTCWLSTRRCVASSCSARCKPCNAWAMVCSSRIGIAAASAPVSGAAPLRRRSIASTSVCIGANARRMFHAITASMATLPAATRASIWARPAIASRRSLWRAAATCNIHALPSRCGKAIVCCCNGNASPPRHGRSSQASHDGAARSSARDESKRTRCCASRSVNVTWRNSPSRSSCVKAPGKAAPSRCAPSMICASAPANDKALRVSSSISAPLRHRPRASAVSSAANATHAARRMTRRGSSSGAVGTEVTSLMREILIGCAACREVFPDSARGLLRQHAGCSSARQRRHHP